MIAPARAKPKTVRCAIYTRKSVTEGLEKEFNTLDAQREAGEAYITSQKGVGWTCLDARYDDGGFSGGNLERPALAQLMADIEAGEIDCVVVYKVDRLSRSLLDFSKLVEIFDRYGVSFVSVTQPINTADSTGRLMLNILLSFAQFERETIADRTRDKMSAARRHGRWTGGIPVLGYDVHPDGGKLVVNEEEAETVREIFRLYLKHRSLQKACAALDKRGITTKEWTTKKGRRWAGKPFSKSTLQRHLTNVAYTGRVNHKGQVYDGQHKGIITNKTFDQVQEILADNSQNGRTRARNKYGALLKGLLRCGACEAAYVPTRTKKGPKVYRYYTCSSAQKLGWKTCPHPNLSADRIERLIVDQICIIGQDPKLQARTLKEVHQAARQKQARLDREARRLGKQIEKAERAHRGLLAAIAGGEVTGHSAAAELAAHEDKAVKLRMRLTEVTAERATVDRGAVDAVELSQALGMFDPIWDVLYPAEQARIIELLVQTVEYNGSTGNLAVTFHPVGIKALAGELAKEESA